MAMLLLCLGVQIVLTCSSWALTMLATINGGMVLVGAAGSHSVVGSLARSVLCHGEATDSTCLFVAWITPSTISLGTGTPGADGRTLVAPS